LKCKYTPIAIKTLKNNEEIIQENNPKIGENDKKNSEKNQTPPKAVFWNKVIETLRQDRNQILCSNLAYIRTDSYIRTRPSNTPIFPILLYHVSDIVSYYMSVSGS